MQRFAESVATQERGATAAVGSSDDGATSPTLVSLQRVMPGLQAISPLWRTVGRLTKTVNSLIS